MATNSPELLLDALKTIWGGSPLYQATLLPLLRKLNRSIVLQKRIAAVQRLGELATKTSNLFRGRIKELSRSPRVKFGHYVEPTACDVLLKLTLETVGLLRSGMKARVVELQKKGAINDEEASQKLLDIDASLSFEIVDPDDYHTVFKFIDFIPPPSDEDWRVLRADLVGELRELRRMLTKSADDSDSKTAIPPVGNQTELVKSVDDEGSTSVIRSPEPATDRQPQNIRDEAARRIAKIRQLHRHLIQGELWRGKAKVNDAKKNVRNWIRRDWDSPLKGQKQFESGKLPWRYVLTETGRIRLETLKDELEPILFIH